MELTESTEAIRRKILSDAETAAKKIIEEAREKAEEALNSTIWRAKEKKDGELKRRKKYNDEKTRENIAEKKVEWHRRIQTYKSELIDKVFDSVKQRIQKFVREPVYNETLFNLIIEAGVALGGGQLSVKTNKSDKQALSNDAIKHLAQEIEKRTNTVTKLILDKDDVNVLGGAVLSSLDQKATINNTFETRLERIMHESKSELETILFK